MNWSVGDVLPPWQVTITREQVVRYAGASDDYNPIHYDDALARDFGLPGAIAHGMLSMGLMARYMTQVLGTRHFSSFGARFRAMVEPGDTVEFSGRVTAVDGSRVSVQVTAEVWGKGGKVVAVQGKAELAAAEKEANA